MHGASSGACGGLLPHRVSPENIPRGPPVLCCPDAWLHVHARVRGVQHRHAPHPLQAPAVPHRQKPHRSGAGVSGAHEPVSLAPQVVCGRRSEGKLQKEHSNRAHKIWHAQRRPPRRGSYPPPAPAKLLPLRQRARLGVERKALRVCFGAPGGCHARGRVLRPP